MLHYIVKVTGSSKSFEKISYYSEVIAVVFNQGQVCPPQPGDIWQCRDIFGCQIGIGNAPGI